MGRMAALESVLLHLEMVDNSDCILEPLLTAKTAETLSGEMAPTAFTCYIARMKKMSKEDEKMAMSYCVYGCKDHDLFVFYCLALVHIQGCICH